VDGELLGTYTYNTFDNARLMYLLSTNTNGSSTILIKADTFYKAYEYAKDNGYKEVIVTDRPSDDKEYIQEYIESDNRIEVRYKESK